MTAMLERPAFPEFEVSEITLLKKLRTACHSDIVAQIEALKDKVNRLELMFNITDDFNCIDSIIYEHNKARAQLSDMFRLIEPAPGAWA